MYVSVSEFYEAVSQIPHKPVSIERRIKSWKIQYNLKRNKPGRLKFKRQLKFFKLGLSQLK